MQYFDVQRAKSDGMSDEEIKRIMDQMKLKPKPVETPSPKPQNTTSSGMGVDEALYQEPKQKSFLASVGEGALNLGKNIGEAIIKAPSRLGRALGESMGMKATEKETQKNTDKLLKIAQENTKKASDLQKQGKNDEAMRFYKLAQDSLAKIQEQSAETIAAAEKGKEDLIKGGAGTAAFFIPGGQATLAGRTATAAATGAAAGYGTSEKGEEVESALGGAVIGGALPVIGQGIKWLFSRGGVKTTEEVAKESTNALKRAGDYLREDATKIRVRPSVYGAKKEKAILDTLQELGIEGTPNQKYALLEPKMNQLGNQIQDELTKNPKKIPISKVVNQFRESLKSSIRTSDLSSTTAQKEVKGYLKDLYEYGGFTKGTIDSKDFFALKKLVNEDYQTVAKKLDLGSSLTDREKVIQVARQVFDDVVTKSNPAVKDLTVMQSHLYDAASSLSRARDVIPTTRVAGTTLPTPVIRGGEDFAGRVLQKAGGAVEKVKGAVKQAGMTTAGAVKAVTPPTNVLVAGGVGMLGGEQDTENAQNQQEQVPTSDQGTGEQDQVDQQGQHDLSVAQPEDTVTGYSVKELGTALTQARLNGDSAAVKDLKAMYDMEVSYQDKLTKQTKATKKTEAQQAREDTGMLATKAIGQLKGGNVKTGFVMAPLEEAKGVIGKGDKPTLEFNNTITQIKATIAKARAGTSFTPNEEKLLNKYTPKIGDSKQVLEIKLAALEDFFTRYTNVVPDSSVNIDIGGMSTDNATGGL